MSRVSERVVYTNMAYWLRGNEASPWVVCEIPAGVAESGCWIAGFGGGADEDGVAGVLHWMRHGSRPARVDALLQEAELVAVALGRSPRVTVERVEITRATMAGVLAGEAWVAPRGRVSLPVPPLPALAPAGSAHRGI